MVSGCMAKEIFNETGIKTVKSGQATQGLRFAVLCERRIWHADAVVLRPKIR